MATARNNLVAGMIFSEHAAQGRTQANDPDPGKENYEELRLRPAHDRQSCGVTQEIWRTTHRHGRGAVRAAGPYGCPIRRGGLFETARTETEGYRHHRGGRHRRER